MMYKPYNRKLCVGYALYCNVCKTVITAKSNMDIILYIYIYIYIYINVII